jgi:hypothetical protein
MLEQTLKDNARIYYDTEGKTEQVQPPAAQSFVKPISISEEFEIERAPITALFKVNMN